MIGTIDYSRFLKATHHRYKDLAMPYPLDWEPVCKHGIAVLATFFNLVGSELQPITTLTALEKNEKAVRRRRRESKDLRIRKTEGGRFLGCYLVQTPADKSYDVEIRSLGETVNLAWVWVLLGEVRDVGGLVPGGFVEVTPTTP